MRRKCNFHSAYFHLSKIIFVIDNNAKFRIYLSLLIENGWDSVVIKYEENCISIDASPLLT